MKVRPPDGAVSSLVYEGPAQSYSAYSKGQGPPLWVYIVLAIILVVVSIFVNPLYRTIEYAKSNNARLESMEIAGVINMMKTSSSDGMEYKKFTMRDCAISVTENFVNVSLVSGQNKLDGITNIIQNRIRVVPTSDPIDCKQGTLTIAKSGNTIKVR